MTLVRILKDLGFEQAGEVVDYRGGDLDERVANGDIALIDTTPVIEVAIEAPGVVEPIVEEPVEPTEVVEETTPVVEPVVEGE